MTSLHISEPYEHISDNTNIYDPIDAAIFKFQNHTSIEMIKKTMHLSRCAFKLISLADVIKEVNSLSIKKSSPKNSVCALHLKENIEICGEVLLEIINKSISNSDFEEDMQLADISPISKNNYVSIKSNYRPISGLPSC